jgi:hypothetical protein
MVINGEGLWETLFKNGNGTVTGQNHNFYCNRISTFFKVEILLQSRTHRLA